jgi:hypothetical protein
MKSEAEALDKAKRRLEDSERRAVVARTSTMKVLQSLAAGVEPAGPPGTDAPWIEFQARMLQARRDIDRSQERLLHEIDDLKLPRPQSYTRVREGVIGGMCTDAEWARQLASKGWSPFTGKLKNGMGTTVVSFGTPGQKESCPYDIREIGRVVGDHLTVGEVSLRTPQAEAAIAALAGKDFDRLIVHSNGASVVQALLTHGGVMRVKELHIMGGDGSMANGPALQALLDSGAVNRIVVWRTVKDPIPMGTSLDQWLKVGQLSESFALRMVRKASGYLAAGDARVEYPKALVPPGTTETRADQYFDFAQHDLQKSYYPAVAKAFGVAWPGGN